METSVNKVSPAEFETASDWAIAARLLIPYWSPEQNKDDPDAVHADFRYIGAVWSGTYQIAMENLAEYEAGGWATEHDVDGNLWIMAPELGSLVDESGDFFLSNITAEQAENAAYMFRRIRGFNPITGEVE